MINYNNKKFRTVLNTAGGEVGTETIFDYQQQGMIVTARYTGGNIIKGHLIALTDESGRLNMHYHHINIHYEPMAGTCIAIPEILADQKIRLHEKWQWTSGKKGNGESITEEI